MCRRHCGAAAKGGVGVTVLETRDLCYTYGAGMPFAHAALRGVSVTFEEGSLTAVIGHTGSGKSTLAQHLNGLLKPESGEILLEGKNIWEDPKKIRDVRFKVGMVFQYPEYQLFEDTVEKDIAFGPRNMELSEEEIAARVKEAAAAVGLSDTLLQKSPFDLSGGEKRRAAIAGVLAMRPRVLVLDEPTAGLDPVGREQMLRQIEQYRETHDATVLLISHSMEDVARLADRVLVLKDGEVAMYDTAPAVFARADELEAMGLTVPSVARVFAALRQRGVPVPADVYTVKKACAVLCDLFEERGVPTC
ncbi:MAG: energy-coupling factor transporter ATPase [Clostridia bacterium]|nr:MAG: energy-coupling factor transporter ATPase [Clostridia bacterium]